MEYQKIKNLLGNISNQPSKFRTKNWVEINDEPRGTYNTNSQINLKLQCQSRVYVIIVMHTHFLKEP